MLKHPRMNHYPLYRAYSFNYFKLLSLIHGKKNKANITLEEQS